MNRPAHPDRAKIRDRWVKVRITREQARRYEGRAAKLGVSVSQWLRSLADRDARM